MLKTRKKITQALNDFSMIEPNDKVMVCVSGGKDSSILLMLLKEIQTKAPFDFHLEAAILDQKQPGFDLVAFETWVTKELQIKLNVIERDTYSIVKEKITDGGVYCSLCSRLRRAILYDYAFDHGFHKIALGHHQDDLIETVLMNMFFTGNISSMPPKLKSDDGRNTLIRPLCYVEESDLIAIHKELNFPIIPCNLCGSQEGLKRKKIKKLLGDLQKEIPSIKQSLLTSLGNVKPSQLMDQDLWNFHWKRDLNPEASPSSKTTKEELKQPPSSLQ